MRGSLTLRLSLLLLKLTLYPKVSFGSIFSSWRNFFSSFFIWFTMQIREGDGTFCENKFIFSEEVVLFLSLRCPFYKSFQAAPEKQHKKTDWAFVRFHGRMKRRQTEWIGNAQKMYHTSTFKRLKKYIFLHLFALLCNFIHTDIIHPEPSD